MLTYIIMRFMTVKTAAEIISVCQKTQEPQANTH